MSDRRGKGRGGGGQGGQAGQADPAANNLAQFKYTAMSNLVLQADRRFVTRRTDENTGDPESLAGRLSINDMGGRTLRDKAPVQKRARLQGADIERGSYNEGAAVLRQQGSAKSRADQRQIRGGGILSQQDLLVEGLKYRP